MSTYSKTRPWCAGAGILQAKKVQLKKSVFFELVEHPTIDIRLGDTVIIPYDVLDLTQPAGPGKWCGRVRELSPNGKAVVELLNGDVISHDVQQLFVIANEDDGEDEDDDEEDVEDGDTEVEEENQDDYDTPARGDAASDDEEFDDLFDEIIEPQNIDGTNSLTQSSKDTSTRQLADHQVDDDEDETWVDAREEPIEDCVTQDAPDAFDMTEVEPTDHHFCSEPSAPSRSQSAAIRREMGVLRRGLPDADEASGTLPIVVRAFESRSDLFRAMVVGPPSTPYADVPFFFDICLSSSYPREPPLVHFHAHYVGSERLNPNLYADGKVCLSLLGTWSGPVWEPDKSTTLQVLLSLQGLVLVEEPYFNEPGHEFDKGSEEGRRSSMLYNEHARLSSLRAAANVARQPPVGFEAIVSHHFRYHGPRLVQRCEEELSGRIVSDGYRKVLEKSVLPRLRSIWPPASIA